MPKVKTESSSSSAAPAKLQLFMIKHQKRTVLVPRPKTFQACLRSQTQQWCRRLHFFVLQAALDLTRKHFKALVGREVYFETTQADIAVGQSVELTDDVWEGIIDSLTALEAFERKQDVQAESTAVAQPTRRNAFAALPSPPVQPERRGIMLHLASSIKGTQKFSIRANSTTTWAEIAHTFWLKNRGALPDLCEGDLRLTLYGYRMSSVIEIGEDIDDWDESHEVFVSQVLRGGKPVIYLWTPQPREVSVDLSLTPHWSFSAVYPVAPITPTKQAGQTLTWNVLTREDGNLQDKATGLEVNSLFWEAETNSHVGETPDSPPSSRPSTPVAGVDAFNPIKATLADHDSVLLRVSDMTPYLDASLRALGLHTEARTSFITYWLPSFLRHEYVALRFVPQASYEQAARLEVTPAPDVVVRVFMVFKGVKAAALDAWPAARAQEDVAAWRGVVGLGDAAQMQDKSLFRVLEWGGMEVLV